MTAKDRPNSAFLNIRYVKKGVCRGVSLLTRPSISDRVGYAGPMFPGSFPAAVLSLIVALLSVSCVQNKASKSEPAPNRSDNHLSQARSADPTTLRTNEPLAFEIRIKPGLLNNPTNGRMLLLFSRKANSSAPTVNWFKLEPVFAKELTNFAPGQTVEFLLSDFRSPTAFAFPKPLDGLEPGVWYVQALFDLDETTANFTDGPGNLYSSQTRCELHRGKGGRYELELSQWIEGATLQTNEWVKLFEFQSPSLTRFHRKPVFLRAGVVLPPAHTNSGKRFPAVYVIPGFTGRHTAAASFIESSRGERWKEGKWPHQGVLVLLDPDVPHGHSVFANSDNNGPVGDALIQEFIPALEREFRLISEPQARAVTGHSSGGWSSLWLQITYPKFFGGCWSTAPDPVDFTAFQTINIYNDRNGHWTAEGLPRPIARDLHRATLNVAEMNHFEYVTGPGGQLDSFNAVFSRKGRDGLPEPVMDPLSGRIDRSVAESWRRYDIRDILQKNWSQLAPDLKGKIHIICGTWDTFYLEPAVEKLKAFLDTTDFGGYVEFVPGDHSNIVQRQLQDRIQQEIATMFQGVERQ
jgi:hypothetical protein